MNDKNLISITEALKQNINRLKRPNWKNSMDHVLIDISSEGNIGPWIHLYSPMNPSINKRDPVDISLFHNDTNEKIWEVYNGPLPDSDEYKQEMNNFNS